MGPRWIATISLLVLFLLRIVVVQGYYVVAYALGIYLLNLLLLFISPRFDPALEYDETGLANGADIMVDAPPISNLLPVNNEDEFRPFVRRLPEFRFWYSATRALVLALACTLLPFLNIPVFWPILVMYFVLLTMAMMRRSIEHMIKYKYVPWDIGKKSYRSTSAASGGKT